MTTNTQQLGLVQVDDFKALGLELAYQHVVPFLKTRVGPQPVEDIYNYVLTQGVISGHLTVADVRNQHTFDQLKVGISKVNPSVWSGRLKHLYGPALEIICGKPTPVGFWALRTYYEPELLLEAKRDPVQEALEVETKRQNRLEKAFADLRKKFPPSAQVLNRLVGLELGD